MARIRDVREELGHNVWDTVAMTQRWVQAFGNANVGDRQKTNMHMAGCMPSDSTYKVQKLSVGAPVAVIKEWQRVQMTLNVGCMPMFDCPLWLPPDNVMLLSDLQDEGVDYAVFDTPMEWRFCSWTLKRTILISERQNFGVAFESWGSMLPSGEARVVLHGLLCRELM